MGRIVGAFGIHGWVKVLPFTDEGDALAEFDDWLVGRGGSWRRVAVEGFEMHSKGPVAKLAGCADRNAAAALRGSEVAVERGELAEPEEGMLYRIDLLGFEVIEVEGKVLGKVEGFFEAGDASVMVVGGGPPRGQDQTPGRERMIPFVPDYVKDVDPDAKRITVDWKADYDA